MRIPDAQRDPHIRRCEEAAFLTGPDGRVTELRRALHVFGDVLRGLRALHFAGPCATVFGSERLGEGHPYHDLARAIGAALARAGLTVMTSGGNGLLEAARQGAREAGGTTVTCSAAPREEPSRYADRELLLRYSLVRKAMLVKYSAAFVALPGGFATMEEIFECLALSQTGRIGDFPVILVGERYWRPLLDQIGASMRGEALVDEADLESILVTDSPEIVTRRVLRGAMRRFRRKLAPPPASRLLGEHALRRRTAWLTRVSRNLRRLDLKPRPRET